MAKAKRKLDKRGPLQRMYDREQGEANARPEVNEFTKQHGDYDRNGRYVVNRGGTPIARWRASGHLSDSQEAAIAHCIRLWEIVGAPSIKLVANLDRTVFGSPGDGHPMEIEARSDIARIRAYFTPKLWDVWENVVRFDEPAGVAGSRLERAVSARELAARHAVQFVADIIAMKERLSY